MLRVPRAGKCTVGFLQSPMAIPLWLAWYKRDSWATETTPNLPQVPPLALGPPSPLGSSSRAAASREYRQETKPPSNLTKGLLVTPGWAETLCSQGRMLWERSDPSLDEKSFSRQCQTQALGQKVTLGGDNQDTIIGSLPFLL